MTRETGISKVASAAHRGDVESLASLFFPAVDRLGKFEPIGEADLPDAYSTLLAHHGHMTVTLEAYHDCRVDVEAVRERTNPQWYARHSLLTRQSDSAIVQFGIMRIDLTGLPDNVRREIESRAAPLGRILIRNNLLREVELLALWRIEVADEIARLLGRSPGDVIYGRSAAIHLAGEPAVDLLEIVTDEPVVNGKRGP